MSRFALKLLDWIFVFVWLGVIFYFSSQPDLKSSFAPVWDLAFRKIAHMAEYFVLAYLLWRALTGYRLNYKAQLALVFLFSVIYAISDEFHQSFIFGRSASLRDVLIDSFGVVGFIILRTLEFKK